MKSNQTTNYVHKNSNHPPTIIKNIPSNIAKRLSTNSKNKETFEATTTPYKEALRKSCLPNIKQIITAHNRKVLLTSQNVEESKNKPGNQCNCRKKQDCPVEGECLKENVIYQAIVEEKETKTTETYIGLTQNTFKTRYNLHLSTFRLSHKRKSTSLSDHIWRIKDRNNSFKITWNILTQTKRVQAGNDRCDLCTTEKLFILTNKHASSLNIKTEILNKCPHKIIFYAPCRGNTAQRK
ncbi:inositol hexakisphosphate and diphosphoinositol-pentakisphosphate kinase 2 [Elysia marginata]|uniref:Inositol hexakisphosphate and diphosphoinositol-pentakisphosphate kinase 2 n=1 Tax=Elysia marginata TaxID=1093978 RepID=A0AAV4FPF5_9GAST|nr:inositol hexakisphosphate and diphosphoinositol-pentakisphosphate kinase 2 [Elysia marginata]